MSQLRCQKGDLAVVVRSKAGNAGLFCTVLRLATAEEIDAAQLFAYLDEPVWVTDRSFARIHEATGQIEPGTTFLAPDVCLRPIRDNPWRDETLDWVGKPSLSQSIATGRFQIKERA